MFLSKVKYLPACLLVLVVVAAASEAEEQKEAVPPQPPRLDGQGIPLPPGAVARLGSARFRHEGYLGQFALSPDGRTIAAVLHYGGKSVVFWDAATGKLIRRMTFDYPVHYLAFSPDGKSMAIGSVGELRHPDGNLRTINLDTGAEMRRFGGLKESGYLKTRYGPWRAAFITSDGRTLIDHRKDGSVRMWDMQSGNETGQLSGVEWNVWALSPDGKVLAAAQEKSKNVIRLMDAVKGTESRQLTHSSGASAAAFSPDGKILAVAFGVPTGKAIRENREPVRIALWSLESGKSLGILAGHRTNVTALAFSPDGKTLASGERYGSLHLWDAASQKEIKKAEIEDYSLSQLAFSRDGKTLIIRGNESHLRLWDVAAWRERFAEEGPGREITSVVFSPDSKLAACAVYSPAAFGPSVWLWKTDTGQFVRKLAPASGPMLFSADGKSLMVTGRGSSLTTWNLETGKIRMGDSIPIFLRGAVAMSPDGKTFASSDRDSIIYLGRTGGRERLRNPELPADPPRPNSYVSSLCFSLDGRTLYAGGVWKQILRWDVATAKALPPLDKHDGYLSVIALSADGRSLAATTLFGTLYLWELETGQARIIVKDAGPANLMAFSPDGRFLALANREDLFYMLSELLPPKPQEKREQIRLIRLADGKSMGGFSGHLGDVNCLGFSPNGRTLASGGHDTTVLLWQVPASQNKQTSVLDRAKLDALWTALNRTAAEAHESIRTLTASAVQAVPFLDSKLKPSAENAERIAQLVQQLDSDQFRQREAAISELKKLGHAVEPVLYKMLKGKPSLEVRRRVEQLLHELRSDEKVSGEHLRSLRALEVLERIGDKPARQVLRRLSEGEMGTRLMEEAKAALQRLQRRSE